MSQLSPIVMAHFMQPDHAGALPEPDGEGLAGSLETSRFMRIQLRVRNGRITAARFGTYGCAPAIAAGDYLCQEVEGHTVEDAALWDAPDLIEALGGLPDNRLCCAELAVDALHLALENAEQRREEVHRDDHR